jgi:catechol 2,3-dioxygenase-like lactoylglutathione lyase family enzyme
MAKIRYIALMTKDPENLAGFYKEYLGMEELARSSQGDISLTDSFYNVTLFRIHDEHREKVEPGLHHLGFEVDDLEAVKTRAKEFCPTREVTEELGGPCYGELRITDPNGIPVTLSENGFGVEGECRRFPRTRHVAFATPDPDMTLQSYTQVLGLQELPTSLEFLNRGEPNRFAGDGETNIAMHPFPPGRGQDPRPGFNHIGFLVPNIETVVNQMSRAVKIAPRPADRPYAELRFKDPERNAVDLSQSKGWEVASGKWERGVGAGAVV